MPQLYEPEFRKKIARLHLEVHTIKSMTAEYGVSKASVSKWTEDYRKECQYHIVFIPKYRKKVLYGKIREDVREIITALSLTISDKSDIIISVK